MMDAREQRAFQQAMDALKVQQAQLESLVSPVYHIGVVVAIYEKTVVVDLGGTLFECERRDNNYSVGCGVMLHPKTGQIVKRSEYLSYGQTAVVQQIDTDGTVHLSSNLSGPLTIRHSKIPVSDLTQGDHVLLNASNVLIMEKVDFKSSYATGKGQPIDWDDIGGAEEAKAELRKALELPYTNADTYNFFHKKRVKGAILWSRPGMGKTLLGRACAGAIARVHGKETCASGFIYIKGPELLTKYVGDTESAIRGLFDHARRHSKANGYPAVIFIDEADALLTRRGTRTASGMEQTVVPQFNAEMDGMEESGAFVLLATNRVDILDPAITRPGRIDRKFKIASPTLETAPQIFNIHLRSVPIVGSKEELVTATNKAMFSTDYPLYKLETTNKGTKIFTLGDITSGAFIAGLVERATSYAIDRNLDNPQPDGVNTKDFTTALDAMHREQFGLDHYDELKEFIEDQKLDVTSVNFYHTPGTVSALSEADQKFDKALSVAVPNTIMSALKKKDIN